MKKKKKKKQLFSIINVVISLAPVALSFFSEFKLSYYPGHYLWEFLTVHWCVWNSFLTAFYNWRELWREEQSNLGTVVAVSNFVNTFVFTLILVGKPELIGRKSCFWWSYSITWHYLAPILSLIYFFGPAQIAEPEFCYQRNKKNFLSFLGTVILHPTLFTLANFLRKWIITLRQEEIFFRSIPVPNSKITLQFKKFMVLWFKHADDWLEQVWQGDLIKIFPILGYIFLTMIAFWSLGYVLIKLKMKFLRKRLESANNDCQQC